MSVPQASSITHQHLAAATATEMKGRKTFSVVDIGCGGGALVRYLQAALPEITGASVTVTGFDVSDFAPHANSNLQPGTPTVATGEPWPYADHSVDVMISNQVIEHVDDHKFFFAQTARCLKPDGVAIHLGPVREVLYDDHVRQPIVHKIRNRNLAVLLSTLFKRLGFYDAGHASVLPKNPGQSFPEFSSDYLAKHCNYISTRQILKDARASGMAASFDYTPYFYTAKLRAMSGKPPLFNYSRHRVIENASAYLLRYLSSITLVLRHN